MEMCADETSDIDCNFFDRDFVRLDMRRPIDRIERSDRIDQIERISY